LRRADDKGFSHPSARGALAGEEDNKVYLRERLHDSGSGDGLLGGPAGTPAPTIPKALLFCFTYDPAGKRYVFDFLKVSGLGVLASAAGFNLPDEKRETEIRGRRLM
jgi:hypothetical protein